jgi:hypothetical protein
MNAASSFVSATLFRSIAARNDRTVIKAVRQAGSPCAEMGVIAGSVSKGGEIKCDVSSSKQCRVSVRMQSIRFVQIFYLAIFGLA